MVTKQLNDYMTGMAAPKKTNIKVKRHKLNKPKKKLFFKGISCIIMIKYFHCKKKGSNDWQS